MRRPYLDHRTVHQLRLPVLYLRGASSLTLVVGGCRWLLFTVEASFLALTCALAIRALGETAGE